MIPEEFKDEPNMNVWGQAMDNLRWNFDDEQAYIRDMFANLLISDIDSRTKKRVLPSYVSIVTQLSKQDANFLKELCAKNSSNSATTFSLRWEKTNGEYIRISNKRVIILTDHGDRLSLASEILDNLERLKILDLQRGEYLIKDKKKCEEILDEVKGNYPVPLGFEKVNSEQGKLDITEFGRGFLDICIKSDCK